MVLWYVLVNWGHLSPEAVDTAVSCALMALAQLLVTSIEGCSPDTVPSSLAYMMLFNVILTTTLGPEYCDPHLTDEKLKLKEAVTQRDSEPAS